MIRRELRDTLQDVWTGLRSQPGRAGLSFMGIAVGMSALTVLLAVLGGLQEKSRRLVQELGVNVFAVTQERAPEAMDKGPGLSERHVSLLAANLRDHLAAGVQVSDVVSSSLKGGLKVVATDYTLAGVRGWKVTEGRFLDERDIVKREHHAVASRSLGRLMKWRVGDTVLIQSTPFRLVGMVDVGGDALSGQDVGAVVALGEQALFVPRTIVPSWEAEYMPPSSALDAIYVKVPASASLGRSVEEAQRLLSQPDFAVSSLSWITPERLVQQLTHLQHLIRLTVGSIALLCLVLGGTTLMSLMLANVRDRIAEIGLRRAFGADARDIGLLFLAEACVITLAAAAIGSALTHAALLIGRGGFPVPLSLGWSTLLVPIVSAVLLGIAFSYWPARLAARIAPADALRNE